MPSFPQGSTGSDTEFAIVDQLSAEAQQILDSAFIAAHSNESADGFAKRLGLRNRHQLNRLLRRHYLPTYRVISAVGRLAGLLDAARASQRSLCSEMNAEGLDPAWAYRTVRRLTGKPWSALRHLSTADFVAEVLGPKIALLRSPAQTT